ncbi:MULTISPECIES: penicillin-binding protein 1C [unclassified Duganella]|uniref:penicillin-binding protein 1C n=1 Tax=unclassified Duganella TaxID=2636909 RepID=UPI000E356A1E|nr:MULTISPECIES: penicillin-binding protein 1C [unclassified Duganella]RFP18313.1 penicillin-binding protein 1C [Duganella sp. BJB475]RFP34978.1 penicillin-binding protein 1C [Duganella sp. BJB476]
MKLIAATLLALAGAAQGAPAAGPAASTDVAGVPTPEQVRAGYRSSEAELLDRHGQPVQSLRIDMKVRRLPWVALADISPSLPAAVLQAEDQRFYEHGGVDWSAATKAAWDNLFRSRPRGASTITMQLAAQLDPHLQASTKGRSWGQKWDQIKAARQLDATWTKPQIMEAYLNLVSFRGELQGVGAAARGLFGKAPSGLNLTESMILASLLRGPGAAPKVVWQRACALSRELKAPATCNEIELRTMIAMSRPLLAAELPPAPQVAQQLLTSGGQAVRSTLDGDLQRYAQTALRQQLISLRERNVNDGALVVLDNASGEILAYVGNAGGGEVDGVAALRQAGSTLKPFLYELALERKLITAASVMDDTAIDISTPSGLYIPQNYDKDFKGHVSARTSLASSLNVPAVRTLVMTGMDRFYERLHDVGLSSLTEAPDFYGYSLALGSAEVSLLELSNAYRTLANGGMYGAVTLAPRAGAAPSSRRVLDARGAFIVGDILSDRAARSLTFGLKNELATTFWSAVKTGTSKDMRDNWCMGYSDKYTVGVWVGNFDGQSMWDVSGVTGAAPVWRDVMDYLHRGQASRAPQPPAGMLRQQIVYQPALESARGEWFISGTETPVIALVQDTQRAPKILYPGDASIIAIDPDIPDAVQRVFFQAQAGKGLHWRLDGADLGQANADYAWRPIPGPHQLALIDANAQVIATTRFHVR